MKVVAIVQARMGSIRLPGKVLKKINGRTIIQLLLQRLSQSKEIDQIIVATSNNPENDKLQSTVETLGYNCFRGSEKNVLSRYYEAAKFFNADIVVRVTGDCPLIDSMLVDECIKGFKLFNVDYFSNTLPRSYPDGLDVSVMSFKTLKTANDKAISNFDKEHVTSFIRNSSEFSKKSLQHNKNFSNLRWTLDNQEDLNVIKNIFNYFSPNIFFNWLEILDLQKSNPRIFSEKIKIDIN